jgi:hypothetical protein
VLIVFSGFVRAEREPGSALAAETDGPHEPCLTLQAGEDRAAMSEVMEAVGRVSAAWSSLGEMIDPVTAEHSLARMTLEIGTLLERRQKLRLSLHDLRSQSLAGLSADNPAVRTLKAQKKRIKHAMSEIDERSAYRELAAPTDGDR